MSTATSLSTLADNKTPGVTKLTNFRVNPEKVKFEKGFNLREDTEETKEHIARLTAAMLAGAFIPPIDVVVTGGEILVRDGHCRVRAARAVLKKMPDYTLEARQFRGNEADAVIHMLGTGSGQRPLTPLEQGIGFLRLVRFGLTPQQIADKLGVSRPTIDNGLTLAEAPVNVQKLILDGKVSSTTARKALKDGAEAVKELVSKAKELDTQPVPAAKKGKPAKKKKVTAKHLKKTPKTAPDEIRVTLKKEDARAVLETLKASPDCGAAGVKEIITILESELI